MIFLSEEIPYQFSIGVEAQVAPDFSIDVGLSYEKCKSETNDGFE